MSAHPNPSVVFFNQDVVVTDKEIQVQWYYFPIGTAKHIAYDDILQCQLLEMKDIPILETKTWGMGMSMTWWHCDFLRLERRFCIMLTLATQKIKVAITTEDDDARKIFDFIRKFRGKQEDESFDSVERK